jgi:sporulation integral membrane protein YtvI
MEEGAMRFIHQIIVLLAIGLAFYWFLPVLKPFIIGAFFAAAAQKPAHFLQKKGKFSITLSIILALTFVASLFGAGCLIILFIAARTVSHLAAVIPGYMHIATLHIEHGMNIISERLSDAQEETIIQLIQTLNGSVSKIAGNYAETWILSGTSFVLSIPGTASEIIVAVLSAFFIAKDGRYLIKMLPVSLHERLFLTFTDFSSAFRSFINAQCILFAATFVIAAGGFLLLRIPHVVEVAFLAAMMEFIPIVGSTLLFLPWIVFFFLIGQPVSAALLAILYIILMIMRQLLEPKLISGAVGLHPLAVLFSVFAGLTFFGAAGMVAGLFLLLAVQSTHRSGLLQLLFTKR